MHLFHAVILGIVEGITEFLPVSSTGHLILTSHLLRIPTSSFVMSFEIAIQLGAILAVVVLYGKSFLIQRRVLTRVLAAFLPTAVLGLVFYKFVKNYLLGNQFVVLWSLFIGGIFLIIFEWWYQEKSPSLESISAMSYKQCVCIGLFQSMAMIPGVSRSAATIVGGLMLGLKRRTIVEFSFLLAVPTLLAATTLDLMKRRSAFSSDQFVFLFVGFASAFVVAMFSIRFLLQFIKNHNFVAFGVYRVLLAMLFWFFYLKILLPFPARVLIPSV